MEIIVYPWSHKNGAFSAPRNSRSVVSDASQTDSTDITYVLPYYFLNKCIKKALPSSYLYPIPNLTWAKVVISIHDNIRDAGKVVSFLFFFQE